MKEAIRGIISKVSARMNSEAFCARHKIGEQSFTRKRRMGFAQIMSVSLNFLKKSIQVELDRYMELTDPEMERPMTKQAFSKARQKIDSGAFQELFEITVEEMIGNDAIGRYKGRRVFAVDGTELQLPKSEEISKRFKQTRGSFLPHARVSALCDVITGVTIHAVLETTKIGERVLAMAHLEYLKKYKESKDLIIFDRGYPSKALIQYLSQNGFSYLMRVQRSFQEKIDTTQKPDFFMEIAGCKARVIKLALSSGETEMLLTNLSRTEFTTSEFYALYALRWGIETKYNTLKNKLDIENFSGKSLLTILQDFYATLFLSNVAAAIKMESDEIIRADNAGKSLKYEYVTNENVLIGRLKDKLIMILLNDDPNLRTALMDKLVAQISFHRTAIVPYRHFPRPVTSHKRTCCLHRKSL